MRTFQTTIEIAFFNGMDFYGTRMVLWNIYEKLLWKSTNYTFYTPKIIQWNIIQADFMSNYYGCTITTVM